MKMTRRDLSCVLPALLASAAAKGQALPRMTSQVYQTDQIPYVGDEKKKGRRFFNAQTHAGFNVEVHETILGPGMEAHPPHKHEHEEIIIVVEGAVEVFMDGKTEPAPAGSVITFGSNQMHKSRNIGTSASRYYVVELRGMPSS